MRKNKTFFQSVGCAITGMMDGFKTEKNFRYYFGICTFFFIINCLCRLTFIEHVLPMICAAGAFSAEMLNTAIEHLCDMMTQEEHPEIRRIKDLGAAGVLMFGNAFFILEGIYICRTLFF